MRAAVKCRELWMDSWGCSKVNYMHVYVWTTFDRIHSGISPLLIIFFYAQNFLENRQIYGNLSAQDVERTMLTGVNFMPQGSELNLISMYSINVSGVYFLHQMFLSMNNREPVLWQTINDWYDRDIDAINEPYRPIPSGAISETEVSTKFPHICTTRVLAIFWLNGRLQDMVHSPLFDLLKTNQILVLAQCTGDNSDMGSTPWRTRSGLRTWCMGMYASVCTYQSLNLFTL